MTGVPDHHNATPESREATHEPVRYPTNHILAVIDSREQATAVVAALTNGGFMESEVECRTAASNADELRASSGRTGLAGVLIRFAERIGAADEEMETKRRYEQAMRDNRFVIAVAAPTEERKNRAVEILRAHGAHNVSFLGKHTIEYIVPHDRKA